MLWPTIKTPFCWDTKVLLMVAIIVVIAAVIRVGHYSRAMAGPNNQRHRERTTTHAKTIIKQRCPTGFSLSLSLSRRWLANCDSPATTRCNVFSRRVDDPMCIVPRQEIRPAIISSPNAPIVVQLFQLFTSNVDNIELVPPSPVKVFSANLKA